MAAPERGQVWRSGCSGYALYLLERLPDDELQKLDWQRPADDRQTWLVLVLDQAGNSQPAAREGHAREWAILFGSRTADWRRVA